MCVLQLVSVSPFICSLYLQLQLVMQAKQLSMFLAQPAGAATGAHCTSTFLELANARNLPLAFKGHLTIRSSSAPYI